MSKLISHASDQPLHQLFSPDSLVSYEIPRYQREYSWGKNNWDELFDDIFESDQGTGHFLGTIISLSRTTPNVNEPVYELIDGQQRVTTLSLLMCGLYSLLREHRDQMVDEQLAAFINLKSQLVLRNSDAPRLKLQQQNSNDADYRFLLHSVGLLDHAKKPKNFGNRQISRSFRHLVDKIRRSYDEASSSNAALPLVDYCFSLLERVKQTTIVNIVVESHSNAFLLFESLNNRGMPLTPVDIMKNALLAEASRTGYSEDKAFDRWQELLTDLGDNYAVQERFLRQYFNAFRADLVAGGSTQIATKSNLVRLYEQAMKSNVDEFLKRVLLAGSVYQRILGRGSVSGGNGELDRAFRALSRSQGAPSYMLPMALMLREEDGRLDDARMAAIVRLLAVFFVRRNLTNTPPTHRLNRLFMEIVDAVRNVGSEQVLEVVRSSLVAESASDEAFANQLRGDIYADSRDMARFVLTSLEESKFTRESERDLWKTKGDNYVWTIEHILPQSSNLPDQWVADLSNGSVSAEARELASAIQEELVHRLGNLTITGYNSNLSNKPFLDKRDMVNASGELTGFRNGLRLNLELDGSSSWTADDIRNRTEKLVREALELFSLE